MDEVELLKAKLEEQRHAYDALAKQLGGLGVSTRMRAQSWLAEIKVMMAQLDQQVAALGKNPPRSKLDAAWRRLWDILAALSPADIQAVGWRLHIVSAFLAIQLIVAGGLIAYTAYVFRGFDPQSSLTRVQWEERKHAQGEVLRVMRKVEAAAEEAKKAPVPAATTPATNAGAPAASAPPPAPPKKRGKVSAPGTASPAAQPPAAQGETTAATEETASPDLSILRGDVETLAATLADMKLAQADLDRARSSLDTALADFDASPANLADAVTALNGLATDLAPSDAGRPPSPIRLIMLGSLLGMITITSHLNWKFRNRWNSVGFLAWYVTKLVGAPVISLAAVGLLFQMSFTSDLSSATSISALGLRGASPMLIFAVSIITGLFSNRVFEWLRGMAGASAGAGAARRPANQGARGASQGGGAGAEEGEADSGG